MIFLGIYVLIGIVIVLMVALGTKLFDDDIIIRTHRYSSFKDPLSVAILWPISVAVILIISAVDSYKEHIRNKVDRSLKNIQSDDDIAGMSKKDIKNILFAHKINAIYLNETILKKLKKSLRDREFEKIFLG